jgi:hypothetical protein
MTILILDPPSLFATMQEWEAYRARLSELDQGDPAVRSAIAATAQTMKRIKEDPIFPKGD